MKPLPLPLKAAALCLAAMLTLVHHAALQALSLPVGAPTASPTADATDDCAIDPTNRQC